MSAAKNLVEWSKILSTIPCDLCGAFIPMLRAMRGAKYCSVTHQQTAAIRRHRGLIMDNGTLRKANDHDNTLSPQARARGAK
jgi:hypothetical protein